MDSDQICCAERLRCSSFMINFYCSFADITACNPVHRLCDISTHKQVSLFHKQVETEKLSRYFRAFADTNERKKETFADFID